MDEIKLAKHSAEFVIELAKMTERLSGHAIWTHSLQIDYAVFGSWVLTACKGDDKSRGVFDGRDRIVEIHTSPLKVWNHQSWKKEDTRSVDDWRASISFAEAFLISRYTAS
jgi:hypothetical protein